VIINTRAVDNCSGGTDFVGPCGQACQKISAEGTVVDLCPFCEILPGWTEAEIHCKEDCPE
jgi:hypothetical protein